MIVLVTIAFASIALTVFIERASNDLLVEVREADMGRLRLEAYSALETTLAVLEEFRRVNQGLRSPAEGWGDPLEFAGYEPGEGRTVEVRFEDVSGKISLPRADAVTLTALFESWTLRKDDAEKLTDALLGWMKKDHVPTRVGSPSASDYEREEIPYRPPDRSLRSYQELRAIAVARELFFDEDGRPNDRYRMFEDTVSLYDYALPNLNSARRGTLDALGVFDEGQQSRLQDYLTGAGPYRRKGAGYFRSIDEAAGVTGAQRSAASLGVEIQALRIEVIVRQGPGTYLLAATVAPPGGAKLVPRKEATDGEQKAEPTPTPTPTPPPSANSTPAAPATAGGSKNLQYPFTLLEITEKTVISGGETLPPEPETAL